MTHASDPARDAETREIERVLGQASQPALPPGAEARLMARIMNEPQELTVVAFAPRPRVRPPVWRLAAAIPLAASLALGIYLGAEGRMDFMLPTAITGGIALNDDGDIDDLGGVGDADSYAQSQDSMT